MADPRLQDPEIRRRVLEKRGLDPTKFDIDPASGMIGPRQEQTSATGAAAANAAYFAPEALAGLGAGRALSIAAPAALRTLGMAPHPLAKLVGFVGGALAGPALAQPLTQPLKEAIAPGSSEYIATASQEHPVASELGQAASALVGFKPSLEAPAAAARGIRSLIAGVPFSRLSAAQSAGLTDVGVSSALGAGIPIAEDIASGREINPLRALAGAAGNVALSAPNLLGRRLFGLQGIPEVDTGTRVPEPSQAQGLLRRPPPPPSTPAPAPASVDAPALSFPPEVYDALAGLGVEARSAEEVESFLAPIRELLAQTPRKRASGLKKLEGEITRLSQGLELLPTAQRAQVEAQLENLRSQAARYPMVDRIVTAINEARTARDEPVYAPWETEGGMPAAGIDEGESALSPEEIRARDYHLARAEEAAQGIELSPEQLESLAEVLRRGQIQRPQSEHDYARLKQTDFGPGRTLPQEGPRTEAERIQDELEGTGARYQKFGVPYPETLPGPYRDFMTSWAKEKGVDLGFSPEVFSLKTGEPVAGRLLPSASRLGQAVAQVSERAGLDTAPHELLHNLVIDLMRGTPGEKRFAQRLLAAFGGSEEDLVQASGEDFARRLFTEEKSPLLDDLAALVRDRFLRRGTKADAARLAANVLRREGSAEDRLGIIPTPRAGETSGEEERLQRFGPQKKPNLPSRTRFNPLLSEVDKLRNAGPAQAQLADGFDRLFANWRNMQGRYSRAVKALVDLSPAEAERVYEVLIDESRAGRDLSSRLATAKEQAAYTTIRDTFRQMATDQIAAGQPVIGGKGLRQRGVDPFFSPYIIDPGIRRLLQEGQGSPEYLAARDEFIDYQMNVAGLPQNRAEEAFERLLGSFETSPEGNKFLFQGVRMPQGYGLPDSWIHKNPVDAIRRYIRNFTRDRAFWDTVETDPALMKMLGARKFAANRPLPATVRGLPNLAKDKQVNRILTNYIGADEPAKEPLIAGLGRAVNAAILGGPVTKLTDISTVPIKALAYTAPGHEADVVKGIGAFISDFKNVLARTYETGFNRPGAQMVAQDILGIGEQSGHWLSSFAEKWTKWTASEMLERQSRVLSQAIGEFIGKTQRRLALAGGTNAQQFLNKLGSDWQTISDAELGTRIGQLMQGRYDITNLPEWMRSSMLAPFVTMMRWSAEQANNFVKFAVEPAKRGDFRPLAITLIGGLGGGLAIEELRTRVGGKRPYTPTLEELKQGYGSPGFNDALAMKLISAAQVTGTVGIYSELMRQVYEVISGRMPQGFRYPVASVVTDIGARLAAGVRAIAEGERPELVLPALVKDITRMHVQITRILQNQLGRQGMGEVPGLGINLAEEHAQAEARRDQSVYERMAGLPEAAQVKAPPSYSRLSEKNFDRGSVEEAVGAVPRLIEGAINRSQGNPEVLSSQLRRLRTIGGTDLMPDPKRMPLRFMDYYNWLVRTQGEQKAQEILADFLGRKQEAGIKRQLIPSL